MLFQFIFFYAIIVVYESANYDRGIVKPPKPGTKADSGLILPKQTATVYWVDSDI